MCASVDFRLPPFHLMRAAEFELALRAALPASMRDQVAVVDRVVHRHAITGRFGFAWFVEFAPQTFKSPNGGPAASSGVDAHVAVFPAVTITTTAQRADLRGHFRLRLGAEVSDLLSYDATAAKIGQSLRWLDQV